MSTTVPPPESVESAMKSPVPCISGHAGSTVAAARPRSIVVRALGGCVPGLAICQRARARSPLRHMTAFGAPVVPPV
jgi:hypothetical protein